MIKLQALEKYLHSLGPVAVAVSGGVDSMTLAVVANRINSDSQMYHAVSPAVPDAATGRVTHYAEKEGWNLHVVNANEIEDQQYRANPVNRCYFCKSNLYTTLAIDSDLSIVSGTNIDDLGDFRPGLKAAEEHQVRHPFVEVGIDKSSIRAIAKYLSLNDLHELPAAPCLASRVTTGIEIDKNLLPVIDQVETAVWNCFGKSLSLQAVRCRILPEKISIQLQGDVNFNDLGDSVVNIQSAVKKILNRTGFEQYSTITVDPYERGSAFIKNSIEAVNLG